ncbi:Acid phosphatase 1 [Sesamum alatum]|uniref:Acid phosphatase 1 n=1 Tax=Sesamum alatum TaxID=300844 RepID=A0AAE2CSI6_9LAMI|nr:Acid phosphatase 1 [Sesamum alatum]
MALTQWGVVLLLTIVAVEPASSVPSIIQITPEKGTVLANDGASGSRRSVDLYCESWRFTVETNDAGLWTRIPGRCVDFVKDYITGERYLAESEAVADNALAHAKVVGVSGNGKDAWVFDIDETLLSNVPYYAAHGFGAEIFDELSFNNWVDLAEAPALLASLRLYKNLQELGFTIFLLTGRSEFQRNATVRNLQYAGYSNWERLILRGDADQGKPASIYKSEKRKEIEDEGYIIRGNSGDQWSDLMGFAVAQRSFKLPNPLYYIA